MALSEQYMHESACSLAEDGHEVDDAFINVLNEVVSNAPIALDMGAAGCGSCFRIDEDEYDGAVFWVAQGDASDTLSVKFDTVTEEFSREDLGELICSIADDVGVSSSWTGSVTDTVFLGIEGYYTTYDMGTRVRSKRTDATGVVIDADLVNDTEVKYRLWDQTDFDGHGAGGTLVAKFASHTAAERFERTFSRKKDTRIDRVRRVGTREGENLVLFDGDNRPMVLRGSDLEVIDE